MNFTQLAKSDLHDYAELSFAREVLPDRIKAERSKLNTLHSSLAGIGDVRSADYSKREDKLVSALARVTVMEKTLSETTQFCDHVEAALDRLTNEERVVLEESVIFHNPAWAETLSARFYCGKSKLYKIRGIALKKFACAFYGVDGFQYWPLVCDEDFADDDET